MLIHKYQESWVNDFQKIKAILQKNLSGIDVEIEHIGSTSVKNLAAKPIIDIDIIYQELTSFEAIKVGLKKIDYYHNGDQGIAGREVFKRRQLKKSHPVLDEIKHHLYVCHCDSAELKQHLIFRDYLRENAEARKAYQELKYEIAKKTHQDRKAYAKLKETMAREFVESILNKEVVLKK